MGRAKPSVAVARGWDLLGQIGLVLGVVTGAGAVGGVFGTMVAFIYERLGLAPRLAERTAYGALFGTGVGILVVLSVLV